MWSAGATWAGEHHMASESAASVRAKLLASVFVFCALASEAASFTATGSMSIARAGHSAVLLANGQVLIVGGSNQNTAEIYNPSTGTFGIVASTLSSTKIERAIALRNGQVLICGSDGAELFDPQTGAFTPTGSMLTRRTGFSATLLPDDSVLLAGGLLVEGNTVREPLASAEIYDPTTGSFRPTGAMASARTEHVAVLLAHGKVLVAGGLGTPVGSVLTLLGTAELFDPATGTFSPTGSMTIPRWGARASGLGDGKVLIVGGVERDGRENTRTEIYDESTMSFAVTGEMECPRTGHTVTLLRSGEVLIVGGPDCSFAESYNLVSGLFQRAAKLLDDRELHTATLLMNGKVLVTGGSNVGPLATAELYDAVPTRRRAVRH